VRMDMPEVHVEAVHELAEGVDPGAETLHEILATSMPRRV
jgi:hypothetical protein